MNYDEKMTAIKSLQQEIMKSEVNDFNKGLYDGIELVIAKLESREPNCQVYGKVPNIE